MHGPHSAIEDASHQPGRPHWDSFDTEDGDNIASATRSDPKKRMAMIQWPGWCRCRGMMYAPLAHPNNPIPASAWWTPRRVTRRRAMLWCTLLVLVILGAFAAGIAVQMSNLINNLRFRLDHLSLRNLDECGGHVTVDLLFHVSNPSAVRMRITNLQARLFGNVKSTVRQGIISTASDDAQDSAQPESQSLSLAEVSLGPDGATIGSQLLQNVSVRLKAVLANSIKANLLMQADPIDGRMLRDLEIDSLLANLGATFRADVEVLLMGGMRLAIPSWKQETISFGDFLNVSSPGSRRSQSMPNSKPEAGNSSGNCSLCWFTNFEDECCTLGHVGSWIEPSGVDFNLTEKIAASLNFSLSEDVGRLLDASVPVLRVALGRWDQAASGGRRESQWQGEESGPFEVHLDPTSSTQSLRRRTTSGSSKGGPRAHDERNHSYHGRVKIQMQGLGAAGMIKSLTQQGDSDSEESWRMWFIRGRQTSETLTKGADSKGGSACGLQEWLGDVTVSAKLSDMRAVMLYLAVEAARTNDFDWDVFPLANKLSTLYEGYSDDGKETILVRVSFLNPLDSRITLGMTIPTVSIGVTGSDLPPTSSSSFASLSCQSTSAHVLPGFRHTLTFAMSIRDNKRLGDTISSFMHGGTLQPRIAGVNVTRYDGGAIVHEVQLILESLLVGSHLPAFSSGSSFILRDMIEFLDQASVTKGVDPSSLRLLQRREISAPGASLFFRANTPSILMVMAKRRLSAQGGLTGTTTVMSSTQISLIVSFWSISVEADTTFYNVSSSSCNTLLSSLFFRRALEASMHLHIGSVVALPISLEIPANFLGGQPVWSQGSIFGAEAGGAKPCSVRKGLTTGTLCNDIASTISYTPASLTTSLAYGGSTVASRWTWPIDDSFWNSSLRDTSTACQMVTADLGQSGAKATNSEEEEVCGRAATETGVGSPLPAWSTTAPVELVVNNICTCVHGVGQCRGSPIGSGQGQMPGSSAPGSLPHWLIESQTSNWRCEAEGLRVALCSSSE